MKVLLVEDDPKMAALVRRGLTENGNATDVAPDVAVKPGTVQKARTGTTVIGEQEAPIGLYIMPWRQSQSQAGLDRPARLLDEALLPLDLDVFKRQVEYHRALAAHLEKTGRATP